MTCCCDANEALRRDNADLARQKDRLIAEAETLRQRVASLEKDNADLDAESAHLHETYAKVDRLCTEHIETLEGYNTDLRAENARLKVDLMNARVNQAFTVTYHPAGY